MTQRHTPKNAPGELDSWAELRAEVARISDVSGMPIDEIHTRALELFVYAFAARESGGCVGVFHASATGCFDLSDLVPLIRPGREQA